MNNPLDDAINSGMAHRIPDKRIRGPHDDGGWCSGCDEDPTFHDEWPNYFHEPQCMLYCNDYCCEDCYICTCDELRKSIHDPLCQYRERGNRFCLECESIARIRADERNKIEKERSIIWSEAADGD